MDTLLEGRIREWGDRGLNTGSPALPSRLGTFAPTIFPKAARASGLEARLWQTRGTVITVIFIWHQKRKQKPQAEAHVLSSGFPTDPVRVRSTKCRPLNQVA